MFKFLSVVMVAALSVSDAMAASVYYVVHEPNSKSCLVTSMKPNGYSMMQVGRSHKTKALAGPAVTLSHSCGH